ncbi:BCD family MFS transporter [Aquisediminimonas profunda]|uniref:BCD family MFS transporter n=1 Tax=Aquisediminimonas profunda TaxID=1550733 RepID=UPI001FE8DAE9|nr:BCD family MFS transporter [Aquisediminimonas profunda]
MNGLAWPAIARLGLVQSALGAIVMLATSLLNRIMVVEYAMPALMPAGLVAWHYAVQLSRPRWGHSSDRGNRRTPWIVGGMGVLALGGLLATVAVSLIPSMPVVSIAMLIAAFTMIGGGVGASGTSLLALMASSVAPERRPAAAALTWIMMIFGIVVTAGIAGSLLDPFSPERLIAVAAGVTMTAFGLTIVAVAGIERRATVIMPPEDAAALPFRTVMRDIWLDRQARDLTIFIFVSMLAYSAQDLILEPFAGLMFGYTPGQSTQMSSVQHMGVLLGMILVGIVGHAFGGKNDIRMRRWIVGGCLGSACALGLLAYAALAGPSAPLRPIVFGLGFANGIFSVAAIAAMMDLAGARGSSQAGSRMGVWGAAQAIAFGIGGFSGALGLDAGRAVFSNTGTAFVAVFAAEALLFFCAAILARRLGRQRPRAQEGDLAVATA